MSNRKPASQLQKLSAERNWQLLQLRGVKANLYNLAYSVGLRVKDTDCFKVADLLVYIETRLNIDWQTKRSKLKAVELFNEKESTHDT